MTPPRARREHRASLSASRHQLCSIEADCCVLPERQPDSRRAARRGLPPSRMEESSSGPRCWFSEQDERGRASPRFPARRGAGSQEPRAGILGPPARCLARSDAKPAAARPDCASAARAGRAAASTGPRIALGADEEGASVPAVGSVVLSTRAEAPTCSPRRRSRAEPPPRSWSRNSPILSSLPAPGAWPSAIALVSPRNPRLSATPAGCPSGDESGTP